MRCQLIDSGKNEPQKNMDQDQELLNTLSEHPILHLYDWSKECASYGYFIKPEFFFHLDRLKHFQLAKRPTGGGIIFHTADFAFSILLPANHPVYLLNTLSRYDFINNQVSLILQEIFSTKSTLFLPQNNIADEKKYDTFCMATPTQFDIMIDGKKAGGGAQRKTKNGILHQGSIALGITNQHLLQSVLKESTEISEQMKLHTFPLLGDHYSEKEFQEARETLKQCFISCFIT